ncbi:hypothetical protein BO79DRAFT_217399 [Aspergillus costaricaensis CBS 115574]|uniref:Uncharacterized protein n=1 Tax=Aspergillus costaricaensis CBS 115574 TaxID=1448317 RepID=A0ACD1IG78_9EURO|nr:hypothetical protein BO79DRAFT_217399 [Aspergillus costaricaensis CBS 115574]RAK89332.1 hypothetical protein BO79DRAFT_217399 [Aspergillus costaricaensis CBS 115574]
MSVWKIGLPVRSAVLKPHAGRSEHFLILHMPQSDSRSCRDFKIRNEDFAGAPLISDLAPAMHAKLLILRLLEYQDTYNIQIQPVHSNIDPNGQISQYCDPF